MEESLTPAMHAQQRQRLRTLEGLLKADPCNPQLLNECVSVAQGMSDLDAVLQLTDAALSVQPDHLGALNARAQVYIQRGDYLSSIKNLNALLKVNSTIWPAHQDLGLCHFCRGEFQQAREPLEFAYLHGERSAGLIRMLVSTYHHLGLIKEALETASSNLVVARDDAALAGVFALLYIDNNDANSARHWALHALSLDAECMDALTAVATLHTADGRLDEAAIEFERVRARAPRAGRAWLGLGTIAMLRRQLPQALTELGRAVELLPTHVGTWHMLGWTQLLSGELNGAEQSFRQALKLSPFFAESHGSLAATAAMRGDAVTAQRLIDMARRLDATSASAEFAAAVLTGRSGESAKAREMVVAMLSRVAPLAAAQMLSGSAAQRDSEQGISGRTRKPQPR